MCEKCDCHAIYDCQISKFNIFSKFWPYNTKTCHCTKDYYSCEFSLRGPCQHFFLPYLPHFWSKCLKCEKISHANFMLFTPL